MLENVIVDDKAALAAALGKVDVTEDMLEAGVELLMDFHLGDDIEELARKVFTAMLLAGLRPHRS